MEAPANSFVPDQASLLILTSIEWTAPNSPIFQNSGIMAFDSWTRMSQAFA